MIFDTLLFTALLHLTGRPFNPSAFSTCPESRSPRLRCRRVSLGAGSLVARVPGRSFWATRRCPWVPLSHGEHMRIHLVGMWVAFGVAAAFIVHFLLRVTKAPRRAGCRALRSACASSGAKNDSPRLRRWPGGHGARARDPAVDDRSGAARARIAARGSRGPRCAKADAQLIRQEVQRCRAILESMSARGGQFAGETTVKVELSTTSRTPSPSSAARPLDTRRSRRHREPLRARSSPRALALTAAERSQERARRVAASVKRCPVRRFSSRLARSHRGARQARGHGAGKFWNGWGNPLHDQAPGAAWGSASSCRER